MGTVTNSLIPNNRNSNQQPDPKRLLVTVPVILNEAVGHCSHYFGSGCWLLIPLFWMRLLVTVPVILDQFVGYCSNYFGSGCWLLFPLFWIRMLVTFHIILGQAVGYCSHYFGSGCWLLSGTVTNNRVQDHWNSNQQPGLI
jgi:uncharacterized membrane protein